MKKQLILLPWLFLTSCQTKEAEKSLITYDHTEFRNFICKPYVVDYQKSIELDFEVLLNEPKIDLKSKFDSVRFLSNMSLADSKTEKLSAFRYRIQSSSEKFTKFILKVAFYDSVSNTESYDIDFGTIYFLPKESDFFHISSVDDFKKAHNYSAIMLDADIDFKDEPLDDTFAFKQSVFFGCFLNPKNYKLKNLNITDSSFFSDKSDNAYYDSLSFENINITNTSSSRKGIGLISKESEKSYYHNISIQNMTVNTVALPCGGLTGKSLGDHFVGCQIDNLNFLSTDSNHPASFGGLSGTYHSYDPKQYSYFFHHNSMLGNFYQNYFIRMNQEEALKNIKEFYTTIPKLYTITDNNIRLTTDSVDSTGGLFGISDVPSFDQSNMAEGNVTSAIGRSLYETVFYLGEEL